MSRRTAATAALALALAAAAGAPAALARDPFLVDLTVDGRFGARSYSSLESAVDALTAGSLREVTATYTEVSPASASLNLRGVPALASFAAGSTALTVVAPVAGINQTFVGATRDDSVNQLLRFLQGRDGNAAVNRLLRAAVRASPIDPVAGNPNSATAQIAASDFGRAVEAGFGERGGIGLGARFGSFSAAGYGSQNVTLPLDATWRVTERDTLQLDVPLAYTDNAGATSYAGNLGLLYRRRVTEAWTLQPSFRVGAAGSLDLGSLSGVYGLGLVSTVRLPLGGGAWRLTVANGVTYVATFPISAGRVSVDYGVSNTIFRNGLVLQRDLGVEVLGRPLVGAAFAVDTRFTGSGVFVRNYQEFGVYVSAGREARAGIGLTLLTGDRGLFGVTLGTGVQF